jgi:hypothetical protein
MINAGYSALKEKDILSLKRPKRDLMTKKVADILTEVLLVRDYGNS